MLTQFGWLLFLFHIYDEPSRAGGLSSPPLSRSSGIPLHFCFATNTHFCYLSVGLTEPIPLPLAMFYFSPPPPGVPARILCHGAATCKDIAGAAICELHRRLDNVERGNKNKTAVVAVTSDPSTPTAVAVLVGNNSNNNNHIAQNGEGGMAGLLQDDVKAQRQQQQLQQQEKLQKQQPVTVASSSRSLPSSSPSLEGGVGQILYSQQILENGERDQ